MILDADDLPDVEMAAAELREAVALMVTYREFISRAPTLKEQLELIAQTQNQEYAVSIARMHLRAAGAVGGRSYAKIEKRIETQTVHGEREGQMRVQMAMAGKPTGEPHRSPSATC